MGRVTVESMLRGIPVIAFDAAGSSEIIRHNIDGILYKGNATVLAAEVKSLLNNPKKYGQLSSAAKISSRRKFNVTQYKDGFMRVVASVLEATTAIQ